MKANNYIYIIIILFILSILFSKISTPLTSLFLSIIFLIILGFYFLYEKLSIKNKLKKEKDLKEQKRLFEENKKKEEYERILKERKDHIEELKKFGIKKIDCKNKTHTINVVTKINIFQKDKIMVTFFGGKLIFYSIDLIKYEFIELLNIKEFSYNTYNSLQMQENENYVLVYGYPGIKILEININNNKGIEGNKYKLIQNLICDEFNKEIIKVIELDINTLVSISTDYLLIWNKNEINNEYNISQKYLNFAKYENLLILSNIIKLDNNYVALLKQANSNMTKSTIDFIEIINNIEPIERKLVNIDVSPLDTGNNNLYMIDQKEKIFLVGCMKGLAVISGKYMEIIEYISLEQRINNIDYYFDKYIILYGGLSQKENNKGYIFYQMENNNKFSSVEKISKYNVMINEDLNTIKYFKDGIVIIGDHEGYLQLWH